MMLTRSFFLSLIRIRATFFDTYRIRIPSLPYKKRTALNPNQLSYPQVASGMMLADFLKLRIGALSSE